MKLFPTLYKRAKTGKIQEWLIKTNDPIRLATDIDYYEIITIQGQVDGKKQTYVERITKGKQKRSISEQAESEAQSKWNKKKDEGYKSLSDIGLIMMEGYSTNDLMYNLNEGLPKENTDANGNVKPMLAQTWKADKTEYPKIAQPKFNGVRCIALLKRINDFRYTIELLSRSGKQYIVEHIQIDLGNIAKTFKIGQEVILDGELYCHGMDLNRIVAAVKKPNEDTPKLKYIVYDIINAESQVERDKQRFELLKNSSETIEMVYGVKVESDSAVKSLHDQQVDQGYEGLILRDSKGKYEQDVRSKFLLKVKEFKDEEFYVLDGELGVRGTEDMVFVLRANNGESFKAKPKGDRKQKEEYWKNLSTIIGKKATVRYFNETEYGIPFHGHVVVIRDYEE